jgi:hypothetical protein
MYREKAVTKINHVKLIGKIRYFGCTQPKNNKNKK